MDPGESDMTVYELAADRSHFFVRAFATGLFAGFGHNPTIAIRDFWGEVGFSPDTLADAWLHVTINTHSLAVVDRISEKDRREIEDTIHQQLIETSHYPEITYASKQAAVQQSAEHHYRVSITGELSLHGVTRLLPIVAQVDLSDGELWAQGEFTIRQSDYGIRPVSVGMGTLKLKDELQFVFDIAAIKQNARAR